MSAHRHDWSPVPGLMAQYACACGARGARWLHDGVIRSHRFAHGGGMPTVRAGTGSRKPDLDAYDRRGSR